MSATKGYVYIVSHKYMAGLLKIGYTTKPVKERLASLYNTSLPCPFTLEHYYTIRNTTPTAFEKSVHEALSEYRVNDKREFFKLELEDAKEHISNMLNSRGKSYKRRARVWGMVKVVLAIAAISLALKIALPYLDANKFVDRYRVIENPFK